MPIDALRIIENLSGQRLDPRAVTALMAVFYRGDIRIQKQPAANHPAGTGRMVPPIPSVDPLTVQTTRT